jgi:hypothetical protein
MSNLAFIYQEGRGVVKDLREAVRLYRRAVERGSAEAMTSLGVLYVAGKGVAKNDHEAVRLFRRAAEPGSRRPCTFSGAATGTTAG